MKLSEVYLTESTDLRLMNMSGEMYRDAVKNELAFLYKNKTVSVAAGVDFSRWDNKNLPMKFGKIEGTFNISNSDISVFENFPNSCYKIDMRTCLDINSLVGISKYVKECEIILLSQCKYIKSGGIELLLIKGLSVIKAGDAGEFTYALEIINKYLPQGRDGLLECQEELIEKGFERFAKL